MLIWNTYIKGGGNELKKRFHFPLGKMVKRMISSQKFLIILNEIQLNVRFIKL